MGAIYWYSGSLWPSILAHFLNNALQVIVVSYVPEYIEKNPPLPYFACGPSVEFDMGTFVGV
jgi:membrane protease YdiL (CAAX protease family)